jgi:serpin B
MTANGAADSTRIAIRKAIHLEDLDNSAMNEAYRDLVRFLLGLDDKVTLELANSNWYKDVYHIKDSFRQILLDYYDAEIKAADFSDPATKDLINGWIEDKTHDKIKDMLDEVPSDAVMYLINAIYFKAQWKYEFDKDKTEEKDFKLEDGSKLRVPTMYSKGVKIARYFASNFQYIELPYGNGQFNMVILLPNENTTVDEVISNLDATSFAGYVNDADTATVEVFMPKFKMKFKTLLNEVLTDMGMGIAFGGGADFSNLFEETLNLEISRVIHQSFIEVNEEGSEAAAATIVEIRETSIGPGGDPNVIHIDRPFAFFIAEKHSKTILFAGKMLNPLTE